MFVSLSVDSDFFFFHLTSIIFFFSIFFSFLSFLSFLSSSSFYSQAFTWVRKPRRFLYSQTTTTFFLSKKKHVR